MEASENTGDKAPRWRWTAPATFVVAASMPQIGDYVQSGHLHWGRDFLIETAIIFGVTAVVFVAAVVFGMRTPEQSGRAGVLGLVLGVLGLAGVVAFFVSLPIVLGGAAATLGWHAYERSTVPSRHRVALAALIVGLVAILVGIAIWVFA